MYDTVHQLSNTVASSQRPPSSACNTEKLGGPWDEDNIQIIIIMCIQILMSVLSTLMAVLMTASIPLHPMCVVVGLDICWLLMSDLVKVIVVKKLIYPGFGHLCALFFFRYQ